MYSVDDISIRDYFSMENPYIYDMFIETVNPRNEFRGRKCKALSYDEVEVIKRILQAPTMDDVKDLFQTCFQVTGTFKQSADEEFWNTSIFDLFRAKRWLNDYIERLMKREKNQLSGATDEKMLMINASERLKPVSHQLTKIRIAEQFSTTPKEVGRWKYTDVFNILVANKINAEITKDYQAIK